MSKLADQFDDRAKLFEEMASSLDSRDPWKHVCEIGEFWLRRAAQEIRDRDWAAAKRGG
jgi:hypothetical protein